LVLTNVKPDSKAKRLRIRYEQKCPMLARGNYPSLTNERNEEIGQLLLTTKH
jgi:hypothetical protein